LRALDDPTGGRFASHVFAISSVSGGTLGAMGMPAGSPIIPSPTDPAATQPPIA
jgi:hypothetical protein